MLEDNLIVSQNNIFISCPSNISWYYRLTMVTLTNVYGCNFPKIFHVYQCLRLIFSFSNSVDLPLFPVCAHPTRREEHGTSSPLACHISRIAESLWQTIRYREQETVWSAVMFDVRILAIHFDRTLIYCLSLKGIAWRFFPKNIVACVINRRSNYSSQKLPALGLLHYMPAL